MRFCGATAFENLRSFKDPRNGKRIGAYGIYSDARNNLYLLVFSAGNIAKIDAGASRLPRTAIAVHKWIPLTAGCGLLPVAIHLPGPAGERHPCDLTGWN